MEYFGQKSGTISLNLEEHPSAYYVEYRIPGIMGHSGPLCWV